MKRSALLLALLALALCVPCLAQAPSTPATGTTVSSANLADFLATLPGLAVTSLPPAPQFLSTTCTSNADCPTGKLCCYPCGIDGCDRVCMTPFRGHCPLFP